MNVSGYRQLARNCFRQRVLNPIKERSLFQLQGLGFCLASALGIVAANTDSLQKFSDTPQRIDSIALATDTTTQASQPPELTPVEKETQALQKTALQIHLLMSDSLDPLIDPQGLFNVSLTQEEAIKVEAQRLRAILKSLEPAPKPIQKKSKTKSKISTDSASAESARDSLFIPDSSLFAARMEVDKQRLEFFQLAQEVRTKKVSSHAEKRKAALTTRPEDGLEEAERRSREAKAEKRKILEAADKAKTEAERLVAEERGRLLGVAVSQADYEAELARERQSLQMRVEQTLAFRRRVRESLADGIPGQSDALYDELRKFLRITRDELSLALSESHTEKLIPSPGIDRLKDLPLGVDRTAVDSARTETRNRADILGQSQKDFSKEKSTQLYEEMRVLNEDRLKLLRIVSSGKRNAITEMGVQGLDQAISEIRQVMLLMRFHFHATRAWVLSFGDASSSHGRSVALVSWVAIKWLFLLGIFIWWRKRGGHIIHQWREKIREEDRAIRAVEPHWLNKALGGLQQIRPPMEWLLLFWGVLWMTPDYAKEQLEVTVLVTILEWTLGGALAVRLINFAASRPKIRRSMSDEVGTPALRLRSLKLVGWTTVVFGLTLALSSRLVGEGTIYSWVLFLCWMAVLPVGLIIIRWWRAVIFTRVDAIRKKKGFEKWVVANKLGWKSFPAAVAAGIVLFLRGAARIIHEWVGRFDVTRRALAYLFRRELDRLAEEKGRVSLHPIPEPAFTHLGPGTASASDISGNADHQVTLVTERILEKGGGVFAVIGERGLGKTRVLRRVRNSIPHVILIECDRRGLEGIRISLAEQLGLNPSATLKESASHLNEKDQESAIIIDSAHRLIQPFMGGLADFDEILNLSRLLSTSCSWFFAIDEVVWRYFCRAREGQLLFDDVILLESWREEEIIQLLTQRTQQAGIVPSFDHLLEKLPPDADEIDRADALERAEGRFYRMIWDHSSGNPGIALHMWRRSLGVDDQSRAFVNPFPVPDSQELDRLPEAAVFVLRAVIQLEPTLPADVARATLMRPSQVKDVLRYGVSHGYFEIVGEEYQVSWIWFRAITRFLQRRHMLAT
jgi:hypothetical protein